MRIGRYVPKVTNLSVALKNKINAPHTRPGPAPAPLDITSVYAEIARSAAEKNAGNKSWLALAVCLLPFSRLLASR
jgi:alpha-1,3-mannosyltransferase